MPKKNYKNEIIIAAKRILALDGYENMNMRAVAAEAGVKASSIYNHFANKDELIYELILSGRKLLAQTISQEILKSDSPEGRISAFYYSFVIFGFENREFYKVMFMNSYPSESMNKVKESIAREIEPGLKTLAILISDYTNLQYDKSMILAESFFQMVHGHISLSILERADFLFNIKETSKKIIEIILFYLNSIKNDNK